jgi:hypothetical protein
MALTLASGGLHATGPPTYLMNAVPAKFFAFEILYVDGTDAKAIRAGATASWESASTQWV